MDREIIYPGAIPQDTDLLKTNQNTMVALGFLAQATLGTGTLVDSLACIPTTPASLAVLVGPGSIYSIESLEASSYGSLESDTTDQIVKQGIVLGNTTFNCPAPASSGQSVVYLIQAEYQDVDGGSTTLPYYNAANPSVPYSGPANSGTPQNTVRQGKCILSLKTGSAATTGTQIAPTPDAGYVGLWAITVANGASTIVSGNIAQASGAPFIGTKLTGKLSISSAGSAAFKNTGTTVVDPGTGTLEISSPPVGTTGANYSYMATDRGKFITRSNSGSAMTDTLSGGSSGTLTSNWLATIYNGDVGTSLTINITGGGNFFVGNAQGLTSLIVPPGWVFYATMSTPANGGNCYGYLVPYLQQVPRGLLGGLRLSNDGTTPNTKVDVSIGMAADNGATVLIDLTTAATIDFTGTGAGKLDTGTIAANTCYHCFVIQGANGVNTLASLSLSPALPTGYSFWRRLGSVRTDGSAHILPFTQNGDEFLYTAPINDVSTSTLGTTGTLFNLSVATGVKVTSRVRLFGSGGTSYSLLLTSPDETDVAPLATTGNISLNTLAGAVNYTQAATLDIRTNTSGQIRARSNAAGSTLQLATYGWIDTRGRND